MGDTVLRVERDGWVQHNLRSRIDARGSREGADLAAIEQRLLAFTQAASNEFLRNRLYPPE